MLVLMSIAWVFFAPTHVGGQTAYVIVNGNSMEPGFHRGDLVILRQAPVYQIGDIATYRHPEIGPIIHRIIDQQGAHFIFKGDHNTWIDSYRPTQAEMIGKFWLHVPFAGRIIEQFRSPGVMALLAAGVGVMFMTTLTAGQVRPRKRRQGSRRPIKKQQFKMNYLGKNKADLIFVLITLALASFALALFAFTRPLFITVPDNISYEQTGVFSYSAAAPPGIYASDAVQTGEPIFRQLITTVEVNFDYQFVSELSGDLSGAYQLVAEVSHRNGWHQTFELTPETTFTGRTFSAGGVVDLVEVQTLIDSMEQQTGLQRQQYTLLVGPEVVIQGALSGQELRDRFSPRLAFHLDELQMYLTEDRASAQASDTPNDPLKPTQIGQLQRSRQAPNTISILGLQLKVSTARRLALLVGALSLAGLSTLGLLMFRTAQGDENIRIQSKYGPLLIAVSGSDLLESSQRVIEVAAIDDLAKIAEQDARPILHYVQGQTHHYFIQEGEVTYHYCSVDDSGEALSHSQEETK